MLTEGRMNLILKRLLLGIPTPPGESAEEAAFRRELEAELIVMRAQGICPDMRGDIDPEPPIPAPVVPPPQPMSPVQLNRIRANLGDGMALARQMQDEERYFAEQAAAQRGLGPSPRKRRKKRPRH